MPTYFKPLRRKIGVVTLVIACVFATVWVRSFTSHDWFLWDFNQFSFGASSQDRIFRVQIEIPEYYFSWNLPEFRTDGFCTLEDVSREIDWRWRIAGLRVGTIAAVSPFRFQGFLAIPYPWIVIPLTMLSGWLLLSKPRQPTPPEI